MSHGVRARMAPYVAVFTTVAVGSVLAVLLDNVPLGAAAGVATGIIAALAMWPRTTKEKRNGKA
jgi:hypothetical protein